MSSEQNNNSSKRKFIETSLLHQGMRIDQSIVDETGRSLIVKGVYLDDFQIEYLKISGIDGIYITEGELSADEVEENITVDVASIIEDNRVEDSPKLTLSESVKKHIGDGVESMFNNPNSDSIAESSANITDSLLDSISENDAVAIDLGMLKVSDEYTFRHSVDVAALALMMGKSLGLPHDQLRNLGISGLMHDVGKAKIPASILNKPGKLDNNEFALMKQHTVFGYQILKEKQSFNNDIMMGVLQHHEKMNGKGYPLSQSAAGIHTFAKIISVADVFDALVTKRSYKDPMPKFIAMEMIMAMFTELDVSMIKHFLQTIILYPVDSMVTLSNGKHAKVVENTPGYPMRPKVIDTEDGTIYDLGADPKLTNIIVVS